MSGRAKRLRRQVRRVLDERDLRASKLLRPRPHWLPRPLWRGLVKLLLVDPARWLGEMIGKR